MKTFEQFNKEIASFCKNNRSHQEPLLSIANFFKKQTIGLYLEYGVFQGESISKVSNIMPNAWVLYGFDSFEGLPEKWREGFDKGSFTLNGNIPKLQDNISLVKGWFENTIPEWIISHQKYTRVDILHIDCDLYSSTKTILYNLDYLIKPEHTIIVFDELINYPGYEDHEIKALYEYCCSKNYDIDTVCWGGYNSEKVAIKLIASQVE
jgi:hypothetical protein